ncbi:photosynthetic protein synthase I [Maricaulis sp. W15]|uniref:SCO family protein n=1 Tax=Maricaulis sp. W15 TaxID=1772333 RepID=UPI000948E35D|nr:SCO family protein [Maricaulis sp. W15]OLF75347.1 photosynthetic protein synthase I [Maricaulis sp. W15]
MPRSMLWLLIAAPTIVLIIVFSVLLSQGGERQERRAEVRTSGEALVGGPFELVDHTGATVTQDSYAGKAMLIYFGYTYCPDICPFSLQVMAAAMDQLDADERARIQPILITVDAERDTHEQMASYVSSPAFPDGLVGLTGNEDQIAAVARAYRVVYQRAEDDGSGDYLMDHSSIIYLMDNDGRFVDVFSSNIDPRDLAQRLQDFLEDNPG